MNIEASLNTNLHKAKSNKKDEFYTQLYDIEEELKHYKEHFKGKVVYCNCGVMGVPITFLDKYNPDQFEIIGMSASAGYDEAIVGMTFLGEKDARPLLSGKNTYARVFIKNKTLSS